MSWRQHLSALLKVLESLELLGILKRVYSLARRVMSMVMHGWDTHAEVRVIVFLVRIILSLLISRKLRARTSRGESVLMTLNII